MWELNDWIVDAMKVHIIECSVRPKAHVEVFSGHPKAHMNECNSHALKAQVNEFVMQQSSIKLIFMILQKLVWMNVLIVEKAHLNTRKLIKTRTDEFFDRLKD